MMPMDDDDDPHVGTGPIADAGVYIDELESELADVRTENEQLRDRVDELEAEKDRLDELVTKALNRVHDLEDRLDDVESGTATVKSSAPTAIEQLLEEHRDGDLDGTKRRAAVIVEHYRDWCVETPAGHVIRAREDRLKPRLESVLDEELWWQQIDRSCDELESLTDGQIEHLNTDQGRRLVVDDLSTVVVDTDD